MGLINRIASAFRQPALQLDEEGILTDGIGFRYNLRRAVIAQFLFDTASREAAYFDPQAGHDLVRNIAQSAYRHYYQLAPTERAPVVEQAWEALGAIDFKPWLTKAIDVLEVGSQSERLGYLIG